MKQMYLRLLKDSEYTKHFTKGVWYPVTTRLTGCGYIVDNRGYAYLLDLDLVKSVMVSWRYKEVDVIL